MVLIMNEMLKHSLLTSSEAGVSLNATSYSKYFHFSEILRNIYGMQKNSKVYRIQISKR